MWYKHGQALILQMGFWISNGVLNQNPLHQDTHDLATIYNSEDLSLWEVTLKYVMVVSAQRGLTIFFCILSLMKW